MTHARNENGNLVYPTKEEFAGIPNWWDNDDALRNKGYMPLVGEADPREGYTAEPGRWHIVQQSETRIEPRQKVVDGHTVMEDKEITVDTSYIQIDTWRYIPVPAPEPEPEPVVRYSKYLLKKACETRGLWEQVKELIEQAGKWESFLLINDIASDNEELLEVMPAIKAKFGAETVKAVLDESIAQ